MRQACGFLFIQRKGSADEAKSAPVLRGHSTAIMQARAADPRCGAPPHARRCPGHLPEANEQAAGLRPVLSLDWLATTWPASGALPHSGRHACNIAAAGCVFLAIRLEGSWHSLMQACV